MGASEENTHYMLLSIGVAYLSNNGLFRFLNGKMDKLIGKIKLMETCEVTKHSIVGNKLQNMFLRHGTNNVSSMSKPGAVVLPKVSITLRFWQVISKIPYSKLMVIRL